MTQDHGQRKRTTILRRELSHRRSDCKPLLVWPSSALVVFESLSRDWAFWIESLCAAVAPPMVARSMSFVKTGQGVWRSVAVVFLKFLSTTLRSVMLSNRRLRSEPYSFDQCVRRRISTAHCLTCIPFTSKVHGLITNIDTSSKGANWKL